MVFVFFPVLVMIPLSDQSADDYHDDDTEMQISLPDKSKTMRQSGKAFLKV